VDVLCLRAFDEKESEVSGGVRYIRLPVRRDASGSLGREIFERIGFFLLAFLVSSVLATRRRYEWFEAHGTAAPLVLCGLLHRLRGARILLDAGDPAPETHASRRGLRWDSRQVRVLRWGEAFSMACADRILTTTDVFRRGLIERGAAPSKLDVLPDSADEAPRAEDAGEPRAEPEARRLLCLGGPGHEEGLGLALRAIARLRHEFPDIRLDVLGEPGDSPEGAGLARTLGLTGSVRFHPATTGMERRRLILQSGLCLAADHGSRYAEGRMPAWVLECIGLGRLAVAARLPGVREFFGEEELLYFDPDDDADLVRVVRGGLLDPERVRAVLDRGAEAGRRVSLAGGEEPYLMIVQSVASSEGAWSGPLPDVPRGLR
jgi:glycosyltransferase involved in cell wall biosynthesis